VNLAEARVAFRPRSIAETFDLALRWVPAVGGMLYLKLGLILLLPAAIGCWLLRHFAGFDWVSVWAIAIGTGMALQGFFTIAASRLMFERDVTVRAVVLQFRGRMWSYLGALFVSRFMIAVGVLTVFGIFWLWPRSAFVHEASLLEGHGAIASGQRAAAFTARQYGNVFILGLGQLVALFAFIAIADSVGYVLFDLVLQIGRPFESLWARGGSLTALLGFFAAIPFLTSVRFMHYIDGRTRRDGWDIQLAFLAVQMADENARREGEA
jgi:hypothetical protein